MKAAILRSPGNLEIAEIPIPKPNEFQALVKMEICGVCSGTDTHIYEGKVPFPIDYPGVFGHEGVGRVVEVGKRVQKYKLGDRVLRPCAIYPDQRINGLGSNWGSYAEYGLVTDLETWRNEQPHGEHARFWYGRLQLIVPAELSSIRASLLITWKETYSALAYLGNVKGKDIAIVGDGCVGLSFCRWASVLGAVSVTVIGHRDFRLEQARKLGATQVLNTHQAKLPSTRLFDLVVDTVGSSEAVEQMLPMLRDRGSLGVYGVGNTFRVEFDRSQGPTRWSFAQINPDEAGCHAEVLGLLNKHRFCAEDFVTCTQSLENLPKALAHLRDPRSIKAVIQFA